MITHDYWGKIDERDGVITLDCDEGKAKGEGGDGIGSALAFMEWDGTPLHLTVERTRVWRPEPWADLWFVATEHGEPAEWMRQPWPMRYLRLWGGGCEVGLSLGPAKEDQRIVVTSAPSVQSRHRHYKLSWSAGALHVGIPQGTYSVPSPVRELGLYAEGCVLEVAVE